MPVNSGTRGGFTLVEMLVALVITGIVGLAISRMLTSSQRMATTQAEQATMQGMLRQGSFVLASELQQLGTDTSGGNDIIALTDSTVTYRTMGTVMIACQISATEIRVLRNVSYGSAGVVSGRDSLLLFVDNDPDLTTDDRWVPLNVSSVNSSSTCGTNPAIAISTTITAAAVPSLAQVVLNAPLRVYTPMQFGVVASGAQRYLGLLALRPSGGSMQPLAGPVVGQGINFVYLDSTGTVTANAALVRAIRMTVYAETDRAVRSTPGAATVAKDTDSLVTLIALRNTPRP